ncbi:MAG: hypothetical protein BIFFINMI_00466 [Phycisphaerae bacterium]|nr:hypothetical protein [Phycisphaerae bacterium]
MSALLKRMIDLRGAGGDVVDAHLVWGTPWPLWAVLAALAAIAVSTWWAYRPAMSGALEPPRPGAPAGRGLPRSRRIAMAVLRAFALLMLLGILLQPMTAYNRTLGIKPRLIVLLDDSQSMTIRDRRTTEQEMLGAARAQGRLNYGSGSTSVNQAEIDESRGRLLAGLFANTQLNLHGKLSEQLDVRYYRFSDKASDLGDADGAKAAAGLAFDGESTDLDKAVRTALADLRRRSAAGVVLFTDGRTNRRGDPLKAAADARAEGLALYTVGIGLPVARDLQMVEFLSAKDTVRADKSVPVTARIRQHGYAGQSVMVELTCGDQVLDRKSVTLTAADEQDVQLAFTPKTPGEAVYRVSVEQRPDELIPGNNSKEKKIRVIKEPVRVLIVEQAPRWDFRLLKGILLREQGTELRCYVREADGTQLARAGMAEYLPRFPKDRTELFKFNLIILGDAPSTAFSKQQLDLIEQFVAENGGGLCFAAGTRYNPSSYKGTVLEPLVPVLFDAQPEPQAIAEIFAPLVQPYRLEVTTEGLSHETCRLADDDAANARIWQQLGNHYWYFKAKQLRPGAVALAVHGDAIGGDRRKLPLIACQYYRRGVTFYVGLDSTWRWCDRVGTRHFGRFWLQVIDFLAGGGKRVQIASDRKSYSAGQDIHLSARVWNRQNEPIKSDKVTAVLIGSDGSREEVAMPAVPDSPGEFAATHLASHLGEFAATIKGEEEEAKATWSVEVPRLEFDNPAMDEEGLRAIAQASGGKFFRLADVDGLPDAIAASRAQPTVPGASPIWDGWTMLVVVVLLLGLELLIRKRSDLA